MSYRDLIEEASSQLSTYKHPDIDEAKEFLNSMLVAAGLGSIVHDCIESIDIYGDSVHIETTWSARGCSNNSSYRFPASLLDAEDPLRAAKIWGLNEKIGKEKSERARYASYVASSDKRIAEYKAELETA